ncbi:MAG TPA: mannitol dehydrogenase family protein, partial [Steroidobacteraceae bacterium]|nr:mannitol dehydrogenase family protein [Steroidobacteraceae bacterium]
NPQHLARLPPHDVRPAYDRNAGGVGVVHFGPGAFHRAHQAWFFEPLLHGDPRWGISAVSLRSSDVRDALAPQDCLYTIAIRDEVISYQVIGALREILVAPEDPGAVVARLCAPTTHLVTLTVTEKGYCLAWDGSLDLAHPDIRRDLQNPRAPTSVIGFLVEGLRCRRERGLPPYTVISCDNLVDNGARLARATAQLASAFDRDLARWIEGEVCFPRTMVDSITPATTDALKDSVASALGVRDRWPVQREAFVQWVIEDVFRHESPDWQRAGVTLTNDVAGYDRAKLRLLNGAHSTLAYVGSLAGYVTVAEAMKDEELQAFVRTLMLEDILPTLTAPQGLDLRTYVEAILKRFRNPNMRHELAQIAWDGSQKLPFRILGTVRDALAAGRPIDRLCVPLAAWMHFVRRAALNGTRVKDPLAAQLFEIGQACDGLAAADTSRFLALEAVFPAELRSDSRFTRALAQAYERWRT